jgi:hypothetical protein
MQNVSKQGFLIVLCSGHHLDENCSLHIFCKAERTVLTSESSYFPDVKPSSSSLEEGIVVKSPATSDLIR